jgi:Myb-like DNA-binding domain
MNRLQNQSHVALHFRAPGAATVKHSKMALSHLLADEELKSMSPLSPSDSFAPILYIPSHLPRHHLSEISTLTTSSPSTLLPDMPRPPSTTISRQSTPRANHVHFTTSIIHGALDPLSSRRQNGPMFKRPWTVREDEQLLAQTQRLGVGRWTAIAKHIPSRTGKQVRERWLNHLSPLVVKRPWSPEEDGIIIEARKQYGNSWSKICKLLNGRSENMCKNRFHSKLSKLQFFTGRRRIGAHAAEYESLSLTRS